eukprot:96474-Amphidinium_carterae.1
MLKPLPILVIIETWGQCRHGGIRAQAIPQLKAAGRCAAAWSLLCRTPCTPYILNIPTRAPHNPSIITSCIDQLMYVLLSPRGGRAGRICRRIHVESLSAHKDA